MLLTVIINHIRLSLEEIVMDILKSNTTYTILIKHLKPVTATLYFTDDTNLLFQNDKKFLQNIPSLNFDISQDFLDAYKTFNTPDNISQRAEHYFKAYYDFAFSNDYSQTVAMAKIKEILDFFNNHTPLL